MIDTIKSWSGVVALVIAVILSATGSNQTVSQPDTLGGITNYDTLLLGGTTGITPTLSVASSTPNTAGDALVDGSATTTINITTSAANKGGCIQLENAAGTPTRAYVGTAGNAWVVEAGTCK